MHSPADIRPGEVAVELPAHTDAGLYFIGRVRTPWTRRGDCPRQGDAIEGPLCRIEVDRHWQGGLKLIAQHSHLLVLYWMHEARRDLVEQSPRHNGETTGAFALRSPVRPNPVAASRVALIEAHADHLLVRGLDCLDGTPLLDVKPEHCPELSIAPPPQPPQPAQPPIDAK